MSNKNNGMPGKITVKQSGHCLTGLSHIKVGWKSCIFRSLTPPVTGDRRASGKKTPGEPPPTHGNRRRLLPLMPAPSVGLLLHTVIHVVVNDDLLQLACCLHIEFFKLKVGL